MSSWPRALLLGDSLTQLGWCPTAGHWVALLADALQRKCDLVNRGFSGYNTSMLMKILPDVLPAKDDDDLFLKNLAFCTLFIGANDANHRHLNPEQHVPLDQFQEQHRWILDFLLSRGVPKDKLIVIPVPPNDPETWKVALEGLRGGQLLSGPPKTNELNRKYHDAVHATSRSLGLTCLDVWDDLNHPDMFCDGLHFSAKGARVLFDKLWPEVEKRMGGVQEQFPLWRDLVDAEPE